MNTDVKMCVQCGNYIDKKAKFCADCGSNLKTHLSCLKCNEKIARDAKFCNNCGENINVRQEEVKMKQAGWRGIFSRFTWLLCMSCFLFPTAGAVYQYSQGKWTEDHLAIIGASLLPLVTFATMKWIFQGAKKTK